MRILTGEAMSITDSRTMIDKHIDDKYLVKKAAQACFEIIEKYVDIDKRILLVCGNSNNSSDGFCLAKILKEKHYQVDVLYTLDLNKMNKTCRYFYDEYISEYKIFNDIGIIDSYDAIIDALIGNGLKGKLRDDITLLVDKINTSKAFKIAIDLPTGLDSTNGTYDNCVNADLTIAINNIKLGHLINDGSDVSGKIEIADIDLNKYDDIECFDTVDISNYKNYFKRKNNSHKYDYGSVLVIGSNVSMPGAGIMSAISALKSGAGLVTLACPKENYEIVSIKAPLEVMIKSIDEEDILNKKDTVVFGPGLKKDEKYLPLLRKLLGLDINLIVDADGLYLLSLIDDLRDIKMARLVITPHIGEAGLLLNKNSKDIRNNLLDSFKELIKRYECIVVLKGHNTLIGDKEKYYLSTSGNPGMSSAGSGDVLSGIIAGVARKSLTLDSVAFSVYLHGLAGDLAKEEIGMTSLTASAIIDEIAYAIKFIEGEGK